MTERLQTRIPDQYEEERAEMMIDRIREMIVSDREVKNADGAVLFQALLNLAVEALVPSEDIPILLERLKQTTLEVAAEITGKPEPHTLEAIDFKVS